MDTKLLLKSLIEDEHIEIPSEAILDMYIEDAKDAIKNYSMLTEEEYINEHYERQTAKLAKYRYINKKYIGIKNIAEGNKSRSFEISDIPTEIKSTLKSPPAFSC